MNKWRGILCGTVCVVGLLLSSEGRGAVEPLDEAEQPTAAVQALLRQERLYSGPVDGLMGPETVAGIRRYQILHGLRATGRLDIGTLRLMLLPPSSSSELTAADRELLRELAQTSLPEPTAEHRKPIPPGDPPAVVPEIKDPKGKKAARSKAAKQRRSRPSRTISD